MEEKAKGSWTCETWFQDDTMNVQEKQQQPPHLACVGDENKNDILQCFQVLYQEQMAVRVKVISESVVDTQA